MTITITYDGGTTEVYTMCTGYANDGHVVKFNGKLSGESTAKDWEINFAKVKKIEKVTVPTE